MHLSLQAHACHAAGLDACLGSRGSTMVMLNPEDISVNPAEQTPHTHQVCSKRMAVAEGCKCFQPPDRTISL